ncbi:MAG: phage late control D family protein [Alphaproteobacteria bacterium]|nr:phage late control D family protein [Alphaproteobacteria bacterium]
MNSNENELLKLSFVDKKLEDFYLYNIDLEENLSFDYKATCIALSEKPHTVEELKEVLGFKADIQIIQFDERQNSRKRYLSGVVTSIEHLGLFCRLEKSEVFAYKFTVEPQVAVLKNVIKLQAYNNTNVYDVINEVSQQYGLGFILNENYILKDDYIPKCNYNQNEVSTYHFLKEIFEMYGLSLCYNHSKDATQVFVTNGNKVPVASALEFSKGKDDVEKPYNIDLYKYKNDDDANLLHMDQWNMKTSLGVDGVRLLETYPNSNVSGEEWKTKGFEDKKRFVEYTRHFHMYAYGCTKEEVDKDVKTILEAQQRRNDINKDLWQGKASNIMLMPGRLIKVFHAYSNKDNSALFALINKTHLNVYARFPTNLAQLVDLEKSNKFEVSIEAMNYSEEKRFVG